MAPVRGYIDGCFDIMHSGHFNAIRQAALICDQLVVGVHSDAEIEQNKALPVMKQAERYALLDHIKWIDELVYDVTYTPKLELLERVNADFCIHGDDMPLNSQGACAYGHIRDAGKLRIVQRTEGVSTTDIIGRLLTLVRQNHEPVPLTLDGSCAPTAGGLAVGELKKRSASLSIDSDKELAALMPEGMNDGKDLIVNQMIAKYGLSADDAVLLRDATGSASVEINADNGAGGVRTSAAVQVLTSTRRIAEFATSRQPKDGEKIVYVVGTFDMFHVGHAQFLKDARELGDFLLVGILDDPTVSKHKGPALPVMCLTERVLNVSACKWVDEIIIGAPWSVSADLLRTWNVSCVAKGEGHDRFSTNSCSGSPVADRYEIPKENNLLKPIPSKWPELSHNTLIQRVLGSRDKYLKRNLDRAAREDAYYKNKADHGVKTA